MNRREMKIQLVFVSLAISIETAVLQDIAFDRLKPYHDSVMHRFYGPWSTLRKRNGDYVDYNDYGGRIPDFLPASPDITRDGPPLLGNPHGAPANYGERPAMFNLDDKWRTVGLADFRTGIRSDSGSAAKVN